MYGMVAGHKSDSKTKEMTKEQVENKEIKKRSFKEKIVRYFRSSQESNDEDCEDFGSNSWIPGSRYRPEPPEALARASHFTPHEIKLMYRGFKQECPTGLVDEEAFTNIFCQFFPLGDATQYAHFVFNTVKHKQTGKLNFEIVTCKEGSIESGSLVKLQTDSRLEFFVITVEFLDTLSRVARGSRQEKLSFVFALYDVDGDGRISRSEMLSVVQAVYELLGRAAAPPINKAAAEDHVDRIFHLMDTNADGVVTPDELARWCARDPALLRSFDTLDTVL